MFLAWQDKCDFWNHPKSRCMCVRLALMILKQMVGEKPLPLSPCELFASVASTCRLARCRLSPARTESTVWTANEASVTKQHKIDGLMWLQQALCASNATRTWSAGKLFLLLLKQVRAYQGCDFVHRNVSALLQTFFDDGHEIGIGDVWYICSPSLCIN